MSRLDELIQKYCSDGVEYKRLDSIAELKRGMRLTKNNLISNGSFPVFSGGVSEFGRYNDYNREANTITIAQYGTAGFINFISEPFWANDVCCAILPNITVVNNKFLYYCLMNMQDYFYKIRNEKATPYSIDLKLVGSTYIVLPPLLVQEEIVRILDSFTELTAELTAELTTELATRKKQYEYYRGSLLTFGDEVPVFALNEVAQYSKDRINVVEVNQDNYVGVDNLLQNKQGKTMSNYVPTDGRLTKYVNNDILIGNIRPYLKKIWFSDKIGGTNGDVLVIRTTTNKLLPKYLYAILCGDKFFEYNMQNSKGAKMPRGNKDAIMRYSIPVPSLDEQKRIVDIIDRLDILCNDISSGLPAEIKARQQQYEYYRDKLLTFRKLEK